MSVQVIQPPEAGSRAFAIGLPWTLAIPFCAFFSWFFWTSFLEMFMDPGSANMASIGISTMGAYAICMVALAGNWPIASIQSKWTRGITMLILCKVAAALFFIIIYCWFAVDLNKWAFPIIANTWLVLSITSFVGGDLHMTNIPPVRRMWLNFLVSVGFSLLLMRTITIFPASWFPFLQVIIVTGGFGWLFRNVSQPVFSILVWALLMFLMFLFLGVASWIGCYDLGPGGGDFWGWTIGKGTDEFNVFFAFCCGLNFGVLGCWQCWPFRLIHQPFGTLAALACVLCWAWLMTKLAIWFFAQIVMPEATATSAMVMAWHTVFWGFAWVYCFGIGGGSYLWRGQKTPGTWDDLNFDGSVRAIAEAAD